MQVLSVASEIFPLVKTGGLADVVGALPAALARKSVTVRSLVPGYPALLAGLKGAEPVHAFADLFGGPARLLRAQGAGLDLLVIDAPHLYGRPGNPYVDSGGRDWPDNAQRFAALSKAAAALGRGLLVGYAPDIVHAHDWQAGLTPAYLHYGGGRRPATVMTVHNLAFQGNFPASLLAELELPATALSYQGVEFFGRVSFLKAGLQFADRITTVSPTYALEISGEEGGMGLGGLLRWRASALSGILNGLDEAVWDPSADTHLKARYTQSNPERRQANKLALQERFGLKPGVDPLLLGVVSRLSWQKGLDLLLAALPDILGNDIQLVLLGSGDSALEEGFRAAAARWPGRVGVVVGYDEALAHLVQGGSDAFLVPSRFEPCGLTQLSALRYGSVPIVARVGGLADTVVDANEMALTAGVATGFQFAPVSLEGLTAAIRRALSAWGDPQTWRRLQTNGMATEVGWDRPAERYARLYREVVSRRSETTAWQRPPGPAAAMTGRPRSV